MSKAHPQPFATVVYHPLKTNIDALRSIVDRAQARAGWAPTRWIETAEADSGAAAFTDALKSGSHTVIASGGDGTVRMAAEVLRGSNVPIAIVPQGTGNLLARNVGLNPNDMESAVEAAFFGKNMPIDVGVAKIVREDESESEHVFLVLAGMGLDARTIRATKSSLKKSVGWLAYVDAGLRTMIRDSPLRIHYSYNGLPAKELDVYTVMIGNCGSMPGGVLLIPDAKIDDGELDVIALHPRGALAWLNIWNKIGWENGVLRKSKTGRKIINLVHDTKNVSYVRAKQYALSVDKPEPVQLDGDDFGLALVVKGSVDPGSVLLRVHPDWESDAFV